MASKLENVTVNENSNAEFVCKYVSNPIPTSIKWFKNEKEEIECNEFVEIITNEESSILRLLNCKSSDSGSNYQIRIVNELGEVVSNKASLNVSTGPIMESEFADQSVLREKEAKFECIIKGNPKPNVSWLFDGREFTAKDGVKIEKDAKDKYTLIIPKVMMAGTITVKAVNEFGSFEKSCRLDVLDVPKALNKLENVTVNENEPAKFVVKFSGKPKPQIKWFRDEEEIIVNESYEVVETAEDEITLNILSCKSPDNSGNYYAKIANQFGEVVTNKASLTINSEFFYLSRNFTVNSVKSINLDF
jgi:hypothetical protein